MSYDNKNTGLLARNERKEKDTHPDYSGSVNVDGVEYWLSGWVKEGREGSKLAGKKYFSLSLRKKDNQPAAAPKPAGGDGGFDDLDSDVPF